MLSGETASGAHPALAVRMMARIVSATENSPYRHPKAPAARPSPTPFPEAVARMAVMAAQDVGARLIAVFTQSGDSARLISKERPTVPVVHTSTLARPVAAVHALVAAILAAAPITTRGQLVTQCVAAGIVTATVRTQVQVALKAAKVQPAK